MTVEIAPEALDALFQKAEAVVKQHPFCGHSPTHDGNPCLSPNIAHLIVVVSLSRIPIGSLAAGGVCQPCSECNDLTHDMLRHYLRPYVVKPS